MSDIELAKAIVNGDDGSFEFFLDTYNKKIFNIAYRHFRNYDDASEMAQEIFLKIYQRINTYKGDCALSTWVYRVATNRCIDELRKNKNLISFSLDKNVIVDGEEVKIDIPDDTESIEETIEKKDLSVLIKSFLTQLPDDQRLILILREYDGLSYEEISELLKIPVGTVKSRINRARNSLKVIIEDGNFLGPESVL